MANTVPAVTTGGFDVGGSSAMWTGGSLNAHGSQSRDSRTLIDGMVADAMFGGGQCSCIYDNEAQTQEMAVQVGGGNAENQTAGVLVNRIPKTGGNKFSGEFIALFSNEHLQSNNVDQSLIDRGITIPAKLYQLYDYNYSGGGPIKKDRLWFFISGRNWASNSYVASTFNPDGSQAVDDNDVKSFPLRLTGQVSQKNRLTGLFDWANKVRGHRNLGAGVSPEATVVQNQPAAHVAQAKWTSTISSRLLLEAGYTNTFLRTEYRYRPEVRLGACHTAFVNCAPGTDYGDIAHVDTLAATQTKASPTALGSGFGPAQQPKQSHLYMTSLSYVTGAHSFKAGIQYRWGWDDGPSGRHQRRPQPAVSQRRPLRGADLQYAAREHPGRERRSRPLRAGDLDDQASDGEPRAPLRLFQLVDPGPDGAGRPLRAGALVRRRRQSPELEGCHGPPGRRLRPVRRRQDRDQGQYRSVHAVGGVGLRGDLQSADSRHRHPLLDRHQPRRHRAGERARADQQPDIRRAAQPEPRSGYHAALSVGRTTSASSAS